MSVHFDPNLPIRITSMAARTRSFQHKEPSGTLYARSVSPTAGIITSIKDSLTVARGSKVCVDVTSTRPYPDHALDITDQELVRNRLTCEAIRFQGSFSLYDLTLKGYRAGPFITPYGPSLSSPSWNYYITKALANINVNSPVIDLPVLIFELKDMPRMIKDLGRVLARKVKPSDVPGGYLAYRFGWQPLFRDLMSYLDLSDKVDERLRLIARASQKGGTRVSRRLAKSPRSISNSGEFVQSFDGAPMSRGSWSYAANETAWYTARLTVQPNQYVGRLRSEVFRRILGLNLSASSIWEALPWSWLIDYFVNIGDILESNRGGIKYSVTKLNVMCHQSITGEFKFTYLAPGITGSSGDYTWDYKGRRPQSFPSPRIAIRPFLTDGMEAILTALITASALRKVKL